MTQCANCGNQNLPGTIFCAECGAQLASADMPTRSVSTSKVTAPTGPNAPISIPPPIVSDAWASLHLMDSGQVLPLTGRSEYTLGRLSEGQPVIPDLDLSPYQAYAAGVSRLHASLKRDGKRVAIMDLGSANGTYVNGKRLTPQTERLLNHGDVVALGKFKFQVLIR